MQLEIYKTKLDTAKANKFLLESNIKNAVDDIVLLEERMENLEGARDVVNDVLCVTQNEVKGFIEEVVSLALSTVHGSQFGFEIEYDIKRNQSEASFWIIEDGERNAPDFDSGGGVVDTAAFALRVAIYTLMNPKPAPIFILDEPAKHLSDNLQGAFGIMLNKISELLGIQIIFISQSEACVAESDKVYRVYKEKGISLVEERV